jgi:hypothetical protein
MRSLADHQSAIQQFAKLRYCLSSSGATWGLLPQMPLRWSLSFVQSQFLQIFRSAGACIMATLETSTLRTKALRGDKIVAEGLWRRNRENDSNSLCC